MFSPRFPRSNSSPKTAPIGGSQSTPVSITPSPASRRPSTRSVSSQPLMSLGCSDSDLDLALQHLTADDVGIPPPGLKHFMDTVKVQGIPVRILIPDVEIGPMLDDKSKTGNLRSELLTIPTYLLTHLRLCFHVLGGKRNFFRVVVLMEPIQWKLRLSSLLRHESSSIMFEVDMEPIRVDEGRGSTGTTSEGDPLLLRTQSLVVWNCAGFGGTDDHLAISQLCLTFRASLLVVTETKCEMDDYPYLKALPYKHRLEVPPLGNEGGIWLFWDAFHSGPDITDVHFDGRALTATVKVVSIIPTSLQFLHMFSS